jgi:hypothetical protein
VGAAADAGVKEGGRVFPAGCDHAGQRVECCAGAFHLGDAVVRDDHADRPALDTPARVVRLADGLSGRPIQKQREMRRHQDVGPVSSLFAEPAKAALRGFLRANRRAYRNLIREHSEWTVYGAADVTQCHSFERIIIGPGGRDDWKCGRAIVRGAKVLSATCESLECDRRARSRTPVDRCWKTLRKRPFTATLRTPFRGLEAEMLNR